MRKALFLGFAIGVTLAAQALQASASGGVPPTFSATNSTGSSSAEISQILSEQSQQPVVFLANDPREVMTFDFKQVSLADARQMLAKHGVIASASKDGTRFSVQAVNAPAAGVAAVLKSITGGRFELTPKDPAAAVSLDIKGLRLTEMSSVLAGFGEGRTLAREK